MNNPTMECPACKEIEFKHVDTLVGKNRTTLEYRCICGEVGFFDEPIKKVNSIGIAWSRPEEKYPGWDAFVDSIGGYPEIDNLGKIQAMQMAFIGGRLYEAERDRDALKKALGD